ncbi:MFS transporter [Arthrobacter sp. LAPM80]
MKSRGPGGHAQPVGREEPDVAGRQGQPEADQSHFPVGLCPPGTGLRPTDQRAHADRLQVPAGRIHGNGHFCGAAVHFKINPLSVRGHLVSFNQLEVIAGNLLANMVNLLFQGFNTWRWVFGFGVVPGRVLAVFKQLAGINTVISYAPTILSDPGPTKSASIRQTLCVGLTLSLVLLAVDFTFGTLQQHASYLALVGLLLYIGSLDIGLGPEFWRMVSEIHPTGICSKAMSAATAVNWTPTS